MISERYCGFCSTKFKPKYDKKQRFCSRACWYACRTKYKLYSRAKRFHGYYCISCKSKIIGYSNARYCSSSCRHSYWSRTTLKERRCLWCGSPSTSHFKAGCEKHAIFMIMNGKRAKKNMYSFRRAVGFCVVCGTRFSYGKSLCTVCSIKRREQLSLKSYNY